MSTTLEPSFLSAAILVQDFKGAAMLRCKGALLALCLTRGTATAADIPETITNGDLHLAGCASGSLISIGLLECVGRVKSPNPNARGRKLNVMAVPQAKRDTARLWLTRNGFQAPKPGEQMQLLAV